MNNALVMQVFFLIISLVGFVWGAHRLMQWKIVDIHSRIRSAILTALSIASFATAARQLVIYSKAGSIKPVEIKFGLAQPDNYKGTGDKFSINRTTNPILRGGTTYGYVVSHGDSPIGWH